MANPQDPDIDGPVQAFWRYKFVVLPICILLGVGAALVAYSLGGTSVAVTNIYLTDPRGVPVFRDGSSAPADLANYTLQRADFAQSSNVLVAVAEMVPGGETLDSLRDIVSADVIESNGIMVTCRDDEAAHAAEICAAVAEVYQRLSREDTQRRAEVSVNALTEARAALVARQEDSTSALDQLDFKIAETQSTAALFDSGVEFVETTRTTSEARTVPAIQYGIAAFLLGTLLTGAVAWLVAALRPLVRSSADATERLDAPMFGEIGGFGQHFEYDLVATNLAAAGACGIIAITSVSQSGDSSEAVAQLGEAWALEGRNVLVIDANLNSSRLARRLGVANALTGLTDVLTGSLSAAAATLNVVLDGPQHMKFLPSGRTVSSDASLFRSSTARSVLDDLRSQFDIVVVEASPVLTDPNGAAIATVADGIVLVVREGAQRRQLDQLRHRLDMLRTPVLGIVYKTGRR